MSMENHGGMMLTEENSLPTRALWQSNQQYYLAGGMDEGNVL
jgi:hypothetical protein